MEVYRDTEEIQRRVAQLEQQVRELVEYQKKFHAYVERAIGEVRAFAARVAAR